MRVVVVGTGAVGGYFGGTLAKAGNDVTFIARGENLKSILNNGLVVNSIKGNFVIDNPNVTDQIETVASADVVLVAVKAWQVCNIAKQIHHLIDDRTVIIPLQNGVLAADELSLEINPNNVINGLCRIFCRMESYGVVNHFDAEPTIIFGERNNILSERVLRVQEMFQDAGINALIPKDITAELWKKFLFICSSGLLAVTRSTYGTVREIPETRQMLIGLFAEIYNVAIKYGVILDSNIVDKTIKAIDSYDYDATSSLTRDVMAGKPSEIEYQNGAVVRLGEKLGVATPINRFIYSSIIPMEKKARRK